MFYSPLFASAAPSKRAALCVRQITYQDLPEISFRNSLKTSAVSVCRNGWGSDRAIADEIGVASNTVRRARQETSAVEPRAGKDGKVRRLPIRQIDLPSVVPAAMGTGPFSAETGHSQFQMGPC
jgi:hypothetical protein